MFYCNSSEVLAFFVLLGGMFRTGDTSSHGIFLIARCKILTARAYGNACEGVTFGSGCVGDKARPFDPRGHTNMIPAQYVSHNNTYRIGAAVFEIRNNSMT